MVEYNAHCIICKFFFFFFTTRKPAANTATPERERGHWHGRRQRGRETRLCRIYCTAIRHHHRPYMYIRVRVCRQHKHTHTHTNTAHRTVTLFPREKPSGGDCRTLREPWNHGDTGMRVWGVVCACYSRSDIQIF